LKTTKKELTSREEIFLFTKKYFSDELEIPEIRIKPETNLYQDLELDSIDAFNMAGMLEKELDIGINDEDLKKIITIQDIVDYIVHKTSLKSAMPS
jgi:acyl carrier protein